MGCLSVTAGPFVIYSNGEGAAGEPGGLTGRRNYLTNGMEGNLNLKILMSSRRRELLGAQDLLSLTIGPKES